ncbi:phosphatidylinositol-3-phosphatase ymr1 [Yamadazyma tenuis]|uniref:phosphatidylinositol-3-phosphatase ymr1 n=1 Tax=Candida tenuis TaxID=2315449 RepID=UPI0027A1526F|nr:phosphatidylinositol-3-phosphatase ymr1 [Yamadazyma tenuis]
MTKSRGSSLHSSRNNQFSVLPNGELKDSQLAESYKNTAIDHYSASNIRIQCKDFTFYSFDFVNEMTCKEVFLKLSALITVPKVQKDIKSFYAFYYKANSMELNLTPKGWDIYDPVSEYRRLDLFKDDGSASFWRITNVNEQYKLCPSYPSVIVVPSSISDNVVKHASKFRSKQRIPAIVYKHRLSPNGNVIVRCSQPLVGINIQNRSIQDEKLIGEIFKSQESERLEKLNIDSEFIDQPQRNLIVDLRPITNAMAQHALGAGTENIDYYRGDRLPIDKENGSSNQEATTRNVDKIFGNIDNIHVIRDSLNKLTNALNDLDQFPVSVGADSEQVSISIILQSVDRITKSIHLNNTNVVIHCSDGWDRTSQVSALSQLCLDPYYRTLHGFMILIEKEWVSFGFKFNTRADHGGCIGAVMPKPVHDSSEFNDDSELPNGSARSVASFLQKAANKAATRIRNTAVAAAEAATNSNSSSTVDLNINNNSSTSEPTPEASDSNGGGSFSGHAYGGSNEKSPVFHQFLDCVYQIYKQHPQQFEFNSRFLKRLFYHYYSCQYGSFVCDSERELKMNHKLHESTVSVWDYFNSRSKEFINPSYERKDEVVFFNYSDVKWWTELYGRSDEEMNGLSNSLDRKFAKINLTK